MSKRKKNNYSFFPIFLAIISLLVLVLGVWAVGRVRLNLQRKAAEETKTKVTVLKWVPIDLVEFREKMNSEKKALNIRVTELKKRQGGVNQKELDALQRSTEVKNLMVNGLGLMDINKDNKVDYQEFNTGIVETSEKIFKLRHSKTKTLASGLYDEEGKKVKDEKEKVLSKKKDLLKVIVEAGIYDELRDALKQYRDDVKKELGYKVSFYRCNGCTREEMKQLLRKEGTVGALFVGDLPLAWYRTTNCFGWAGYNENFPIDLYFMDLNGTWGNEVPCGNTTCFTSHGGDRFPEIFVARLAAPVESDEVRLIKHYLAKNHQLRQSGPGVAQKSLNYIDDDWRWLGTWWSQEVSPAYPAYDLVNDMNTTNGYDFKQRWDDGYEHLLVAVHSNPFAHYFSPWVSGGSVSWTDVKAQKPRFHFYNLFACSNALYTVENYMAGWYVFQESNFGLLAVGSTKTGAMLQFRAFYSPLSRSANFGVAFQEWFKQPSVVVDKCWHGGMTLIGDPTLRVFSKR